MDEQIKALVANFTTFEANLKTTLDKQAAEIRTNGEASEATGSKVAELTNKLSEVGQEIKALQARIHEVENESVRPNAPGAQAKSLGQRFAESDAYQEMRAENKARSDRFEVGSFFNLDSSSGSGGALVVPHRYDQIIAPPTRDLRLRDILDVQRTESNAIEYVEETLFDNNAAPVKESRHGVTNEEYAKPKSDLTFALKSVNVQTIAHWLPATRQILADASQLAAYIDGRLLYGLKVKEETQILYGTGVSPNLTGIMTNANVQTYKWSDGKLKDTKLDAIRRAITKARLAEYPVTAIVLHPSDWEDIETLKSDDGKYLWIQVPVGGVMQVWRLAVVETTAIQQGDFLLGSFGLSATLWDREEGAVRVSDSHADFFIKNMVAVLAEERVALTVFRPQGFVAGEFDEAPSEPSGD